LRIYGFYRPEVGRYKSKWSFRASHGDPLRLAVSELQMAGAASAIIPTPVAAASSAD
jgi:hypothetical protein